MDICMSHPGRSARYEMASMVGLLLGLLEHVKTTFGQMFEVIQMYFVCISCHLHNSFLFLFVGCLAARFSFRP